MLANGSVLTFSPAGKLIRERTFAPGAVQSAVLAAPGLIVETAAGLEIHGVGADAGLPAAAGRPLPRLLRGNRRVRDRTGAAAAPARERPATRLFRRLEPRFHAQLGRRGLAYASGRTLGFSVWAIVSAAV